MQTLIDFAKGLFLISLMGGFTILSVYAVLGGFSWEIVKIYDHPAIIAGMFSVLPIAFVVISIFL